MTHPRDSVFGKRQNNQSGQRAHSKKKKIKNKKQKERKKEINK